MSRNDDAGEDLLAEIDLHVWRVPPPAPLHRPSLLVRALSPIAGTAKRRRLGWILAASALVNAVLVALILILWPQPSTPQQVATVQPAGGSSVDVLLEQIRKLEQEQRELRRRLEQEQRELERKRVEIEEQRRRIIELSEQLRQYEEGMRDRTVDRKNRKVPDRVVDRQPIDPYDSANPPGPRDTGGSCDEVSCVLNNYEGECCRNFRARKPVVAKQPNGPPESLDRQMISEGIAAVKSRVAACGDRTTAKGKVKLRVIVQASGKVSNVVVETTPDPVLGHCVARAVQGAVFARTQTGGSFSYPFVF